MKVQILFLLIALFISVGARGNPRKPRFNTHSDADFTYSMKEDLSKAREMSKRVVAVSAEDEKRFKTAGAKTALAPFERRLKSQRDSNSEDPNLTEILKDIGDIIEFITTHFVTNLYDYSSQGVEDTVSKAYDLITRFAQDTLAIQTAPAILVSNVMSEVFKNIYKAFYP